VIPKSGSPGDSMDRFQVNLKQGVVSSGGRGQGDSKGKVGVGPKE
jgi:hypothetical protein